jgi:hypothetical protein
MMLTPSNQNAGTKEAVVVVVATRCTSNVTTQSVRILPIVVIVDVGIVVYHGLRVGILPTVEYRSLLVRENERIPSGIQSIGWVRCVLWM